MGRVDLVMLANTKGERGSAAVCPIEFILLFTLGRVVSEYSGSLDFVSLTKTLIILCSSNRLEELALPCCSQCRGSTTLREIPRLVQYVAEI